MIISLIQPQIWDLNIEKNLNNLTNIVKDLSNSVDWVIFPEMFLTGFDFSVFKQGDYASFAKESQIKSLDFLRNLAKEKFCAAEGSMVCSMEDVACSIDKKFLNRHYFITKENEWYYDKQKLFSLSEEAKYLNRGDKSTVAEFKDWKINLKTCYYVRFPEICRNKYSTLNFDYDIMTFVASWPQSRSKQWKTLLQARAIENMCYVIGVNRQGVDSSNNLYSGDSCIINCKGEFLQELNQKDIKGCKENEFIHYYNIDKEDLNRQRQKFPVYLDW